MPFVAPFAGAWIEISLVNEPLTLDRSLPSRERGLKFERFKKQDEEGQSLPSRERGLKS